jgi:uncharacterized hydrophobic protein (TIGR00271 family)
MQDNAEANAQALETYLLHDESLELTTLRKFITDNNFETLPWQQLDQIPDDARVLLYISDSRIRELMPMAIARQWQVGILNHPEARQTAGALGVPGNLIKDIKHYLRCKAIKVDVLTCNDRLVLSSVIIGDSFTQHPFDVDYRPTRLDRVAAALKAIKHLRLRGFKLTTGKGQKIQLAALGLWVTKNARSGLLGQSLSEAISTADGRFTLVALSPRSVLSYLWLLLRILFPKKIDPARLPTSVGMMRNRQTHLESDDEIEYLIDGQRESASTIDLKIDEQGMYLLPGPKFVFDEENQQKVDKDNIKVDHLPLDESAQLLLGAPLPFFSRAGEEEHRGLFVSLRSSAVLSSSYMVLMLLSTMLALTGLYANSAPVIIGAMILAPLMSPIISLAMGLARTELQLIRSSLRTLLYGIGAGLFCGITFAWLMPTESFTAEMQSRISPTLLDLAVAVVSGVAGAYAHAKEEIAKSLAGVAIAVALVPPLSVAGIGVGWAEWEMARGAGLLFITNIVGISLAATVTFLVLGFAPFKRAQKGLFISLLLMSLIAVPLYFTFQEMIERGRISAQIPRGQFELAGLQVRLRNVTVFVGSPPLIRVGMSSSQRIDEKHVEALKEMISERIGRPIYLEAQFYLRR